MLLLGSFSDYFAWWKIEKRFEIVENKIKLC